MCCKFQKATNIVKHVYYERPVHTSNFYAVISYANNFYLLQICLCRCHWKVAQFFCDNHWKCISFCHIKIYYSCARSLSQDYQLKYNWLKQFSYVKTTKVFLHFIKLSKNIHSSEQHLSVVSCIFRRLIFLHVSGKNTGNTTLKKTLKRKKKKRKKNRKKA